MTPEEYVRSRLFYLAGAQSEFATDDMIEHLTGLYCLREVHRPTAKETPLSVLFRQAHADFSRAIMDCVSVLREKHREAARCA